MSRSEHEFEVNIGDISTSAACHKNTFALSHTAVVVIYFGVKTFFPGVYNPFIQKI